MKIRLLKLGATWCAPCQGLAKRGTLEKFAEAHPDVKLEIHDDTEAGSKRWADLADRLGVKSMPTLVWMLGDEMLFKSDDVSVAGIKAQYERAVKKAERG